MSMSISQQRQTRWKRLLSDILDLDQSPEQLIQDHTGITVEVIADIDTDASNR